MSENLPNVPQAYQPPVNAPVDPYEPPAPYQNPRPGRGTRVLGIIVGAFGVLVVLGALLLVSRSGHSDPAEPQTAAAPARPQSAAAPPPASAGVQELPALPPTAESTLEDATDGAATWIHFTNSTGGTVTVMWLGYDHKRVKYLDLDPGQGYDQQTYAGHVWVVTRPDGTAIAVYQATAAPAQAVIR
ncbi:hypothetical protein [Actinoplanes sp. HUAS TT8]|uniref:VHL beta domain-containing protein n=1 Tax=Actinoplanes sp. HUAS TT8 TaxID=3447453 RepID=UPI003F528C46